MAWKWSQEYFRFNQNIFLLPKFSFNPINIFLQPRSISATTLAHLLHFGSFKLQCKGIARFWNSRPRNRNAVGRNIRAVGRNVGSSFMPSFSSLNECIRWRFVHKYTNQFVVNVGITWRLFMTTVSEAHNLILSRYLHRLVAITGENKGGTLTQLQIEIISAWACFVQNAMNSQYILVCCIKWC